MELSPEGLAAAAVTRETVAAKKRQLSEAQSKTLESEAKKTTPTKRPHLNRPPPACSHEVALPEGFDPSSIKLDSANHGMCRSEFLLQILYSSQ
jgi:ATP-dependent RNA helicase DOB1